MFLFPLTLCLCSSCYYRYNELQSSLHLAESRCDRFFRIFTVYIIFGYTLFFVLFWSLVTTASYRLAWLLSPFGLTLAIFSLFLYIKSKRLKIQDFRFQSTITNEVSGSISESNFGDNDQQSIMTGRRVGLKDT